PVTERRLRDRVEIVEGDVVAALEEGADYTGEHERLQPAWAGAPADIMPDAVELAPVGMGGGDQPGRVPQHVLGDRHLAGGPLGRQDGAGVGDRFQLRG